MDGTYGFVYSGAIGVGIGVFTIKDGILTGSDGGRVNYNGRIREEEDGILTLELSMFVPAGIFLVQGTSPLELDSTRTNKIRVPVDFGDGKPFPVAVPPGEVTLMVKRIPDDHAHFARGFTVVPTQP